MGFDYSNKSAYPNRIERLEDRIVACQNLLERDYIELAVKDTHLAVCDDYGCDLITISPPEHAHYPMRIARVDMGDDELAPTRRLQNVLREHLERIVYDSTREIEDLRLTLAEVA